MDAKPKFSIFQDDEATKAQQQIAAKASQFQSSVNTLKPREEAAKALFKIEVISLIVGTSKQILMAYFRMQALWSLMIRLRKQTRSLHCLN